ncbi:MAG: hypothetical protein O7F73_08890, partial [Gammaproteobacteria bacterium]|nr:hypothetical protein [Gammaproteobacteria bacterium]
MGRDKYPDPQRREDTGCVPGKLAGIRAAIESDDDTSHRGIRDGLHRDEYGALSSGPYYDYNAAPFGRDLRSDLNRYNAFLFINHEFENGTEAYTELSYYQADVNLMSQPSTTLSNFEMYVGAENYYNPFGPCGSPN